MPPGQGEFAGSVQSPSPAPRERVAAAQRRSGEGVRDEKSSPSHRSAMGPSLSRDAGEGQLTGYARRNESFFERRDERQDRAVETRLGQRPDMLVANAAGPIDDEGLRHAIDAPIDANPPVIGADPRIRIAERGDPGERGIPLVLVVDAVDRN